MGCWTMHVVCECSTAPTLNLRASNKDDIDETSCMHAKHPEETNRRVSQLKTTAKDSLTYVVSVVSAKAG